MGSSHGQQTIQGACVSETAVHDHGRRLNQREFRPMAAVPFRPARQLSEYKGKGASASRENKFSAFFSNISNTSSNREKALSIMRWLYLVALCVEIAAYKNPDSKLFPSCYFSILSTDIITRKKIRERERMLISAYDF